MRFQKSKVVDSTELSLRSLLINIPTHRSFLTDVILNDEIDNTVSKGVFDDALPLVQIDPVSCRSFQELALLQVLKPQKEAKYDISIFNPYQTYASHIYMAKRFETLTTFAKIYWKQDPSYFKNHTVIFSSGDLLNNAFSIFEFRKTFCKRILVPKYECCGLELMLDEINEFIKYEELDQLDCAQLQNTIVVTKNSSMFKEEDRYVR